MSNQELYNIVPCDPDYSSFQKSRIEMMKNQYSPAQITSELNNIHRIYLNKCYRGHSLPPSLQDPATTPIPTQAQVPSHVPLQVSPSPLQATSASTLDVKMLWICGFIYVLFIIINALSIWHAERKLNEETTNIKKNIAYTMITFGAIEIFISLLLFGYQIHSKKIDRISTILFFLLCIITLVNSIMNLVLLDSKTNSNTNSISDSDSN